jgi:hypothetical protein
MSTAVTTAPETGSCVVTHADTRRRTARRTRAAISCSHVPCSRMSTSRPLFVDAKSAVPSSARARSKSGTPSFR